MSKQQVLLRGYIILAATTASGIIFSFPVFTGTVFPFLGVCFQVVMFLVLIILLVRAARAGKRKEV